MTNQFKLGKCMTRGGEEVRIVNIEQEAKPDDCVIITRERGDVGFRYANGRIFVDKENSNDLLPNNIEVVRVRL